jgi:hypothetical protein
MIPAVPDMGSYVLTRYGFDSHRREKKLNGLNLIR